MSHIQNIFESLEEQKKFHLKNIGMIENLYDRDDYVEMMKEDYMISLHLRNATILNEYKNRFSSNLLIESEYEHRKEISKFFSFLKRSSLVEMKLCNTKIYSKLINEKSLLGYGLKLYEKKIISIENTNYNRKPLSEQWARLKDPIGYWKGLYNQLKAAGIGVKWQVPNDPAKSTFMFWGGWIIWKDSSRNGGYPISFTDKTSNVSMTFKFNGGKYAGQPATNINMTPKSINANFNLGQFGKVSNKTMSATITKYKKTNPVVKKAPEKSLLDQGLDFAGKVVDKGTELVKKGVEVVSPYITKVLDSQFAYFIPGLSAVKLGYDAKKVYDNWEKIKKMTLEDWVEVFRNFLNGSVGIAIQIVLALTGKGHVINLIAWGLLFQYDWYYQGLMKGNFNWYNILTSLIGLIGTGAAAGVTSGAKAVLSSIKTVDALVPALAKAAPKTPSITTKLLPTLEKITTLGATIIGKVTNALNWLVSKIPLIGKLVKPLQNGIKSINTLISKITDGIKTYFKKGAGQNLQVGSHAHFDLPSLAKKLTALGDKTITKKVVGKVTKIIYKVLVGDTLQKILNKYGKSGVTADIVKQLNTGINLSKLTPGTELRLA
jgi:hypothetical protein